MTGSTRRMVAVAARPRAVRAREGDLVDGRAVGVDAGDVASRPARTARPASRRSAVWPSSHRHTGSGVPQNRSRDRAQSTLLASHSPIRPSRMCSGCQPMVWFCATRSALRVRGADVPARLAPVDERRCRTASSAGRGGRRAAAAPAGPAASSRSLTVAVGVADRPALEPRHRVGEPAVGAHRVQGRAGRSSRPTWRSTSPKAGARCTMPVPSSASTKSPATTRQPARPPSAGPGPRSSKGRR